MKPLCYDCLSKDVAVKLIDDQGFEHWFCAKDWAINQRFSTAISEMLADGLASPAARVTEPGYCNRCGHPLALHAEAGVCMSCDCEDGMCLCARTDLDRSYRSSPPGMCA